MNRSETRERNRVIVKMIEENPGPKTRLKILKKYKITRMQLWHILNPDHVTVPKNQSK